VDIVLGVSTTPTTVRMVLVEGEKGDGVTVDHDSFDVTAKEGSANSTSADQVVEAVLGTQESADAGGHHLKAIGVTWSDHTQGAALRDALAAKGLDDVMLVSASHAAAALAQAAGRAVGYDTTALLFIDRDTATLSVVQTDDGSVVKVLSSSLHSADAMGVLTEMAAAVDAQDAPPQGMFVFGSGVDVSSVKQHLQDLVGLPVSAPDEPELALARGAALAAAHAPVLESSTVGLAYSQDPVGPTAGSVLAGLANAETQLRPVGSDGASLGDDEPQTDLQLAEGERKPFLLVGSALTSIFVVGVVALVISLAVSIRPTADQRPSPGQNALVPTTVAPAAPAPAPAPEAQPIEAPPPPPAQTIKPPVPVAQEVPQAPPRTVYVESPPPVEAPPPAPAAPPPAPAAPVPAPVPAPVYVPPPVYNPPTYYRPWTPPWRPTYLPPKPWNPPWEEPENPPWEEPEEPQLPELPQLPEQPQIPQIPQIPQVPQQQYPQAPSNGGGFNNGSGRSGSSSDGSGARGGSQFPGSGSSGRGGSGGGGGGGNCFLIFCSRG
jgi:uncharacterized membrane protein YgcG